MGLREFSENVKSNPSSQCKTCNLPEDIRKELEDGRRAEPPITYNVMSLYLSSLGYSINPSTIRNHWTGGHVT